MSTSFTVSPMIEKINLKPGETYEGTILVANPKTATEDFYYKINISPYSVVGEDYTPDFQTMSDWSRVVEWTTIKDTEGVVKPNETKKIKYTIEVPENAPGGGQYLKIGVSSNGQISGDGGRVQDVYEMASLVFATVEGETRHEGKILEGKISGFVSINKPTVSAKLENNGNVHEIVTTDVQVKNALGGGSVYPKDGETGEMESIVMPMSTRVVSREIPNMPAVGIFEVTESIAYMGDHLDVSTIMVICPFWFILLIIAFIFSILGMVFYGHHLKQKKLKKQLHSDKTSAKIEA